MIFYTFLYLILFYGFAFIYMLFVIRNNMIVDCSQCCYYLEYNMYMIDNDNVLYASACMQKCTCLIY